MPIHRTHIAELVKWLNSVERPLYLLDDELTVVFLNRACQQWLGVAAEGLVGQKCGYHSTPMGGVAAVAAGLCPPPQVLAGEILAATVCRIAEDGRSIERRARFLPIASGNEDVLGILAVLDAADRPPRDAAGESDAVSDNAASKEISEAGPIVLHEHIRRFRLEAAARHPAGRLIGQGPAMRLARRQVQLAMTSRASVLLVGPSGSGRCHLAATIHYSGVEKGDSPHLPERPEGGHHACMVVAQMGTVPFFPAAGDFVPLDCALLGADVLEAAGAAIARAASRGAQATASLLFHRVDELPADAQVQLADLLARRPFPGRLMATATDPLAELARRGKFRAELAALLSTITIELPPLAQRRDDLPLLAQCFLEDQNATQSRQIGGFSPSALDRLDAYAWPGNLDELYEVVAESHRRAAGLRIEAADLPERIGWAAKAAAVPPRVEETIVLDEYLARVERELIRRALARAKGNKARAARWLGMTRPRLYRRMVQLGLE